MLAVWTEEIAERFQDHAEPIVRAAAMDFCRRRDSSFPPTLDELCNAIHATIWRQTREGGEEQARLEEPPPTEEQQNIARKILRDLQLRFSPRGRLRVVK